MYSFGKGDYPGLCFYLYNLLLDIEKVEDVEEICSSIKKLYSKFIPKCKRNTSNLRIYLYGVNKHIVWEH